MPSYCPVGLSLWDYNNQIIYLYNLPSGHLMTITNKITQILLTIGLFSCNLQEIGLVLVPNIQYNTSNNLWSLDD